MQSSGKVVLVLDSSHSLWFEHVQSRSVVVLGRAEGADEVMAGSRVWNSTVDFHIRPSTTVTHLQPRLDHRLYLSFFL